MCVPVIPMECGVAGIVHTNRVRTSACHSDNSPVIRFFTVVGPDVMLRGGGEPPRGRDCLAWV